MKGKISIKIKNKTYSIRGFFKGMSFPLITVPIVNAVVFSSNEFAKKLFSFHNENEMSLYEGVITGAFSGLVNCIIVTPVELVKCRLQVQNDSNKIKYKGVLDCLFKIYNERGIKGLYAGNYASVLREMPAYAGINNYLNYIYEASLEDIFILSALLQIIWELNSKN